MLTLLLNPLYGNPCNTLRFFSGMMLVKLVFRHVDNISEIIFQGGHIDIAIAVTLKILIKVIANGCCG